MSQKNKFIITNDTTTANKLKMMGFVQVPSSDSFIVFVNNDSIKLNFDDIDKSKICYSNMLHI